jgi:hypothetical protein
MYRKSADALRRLHCLIRVQRLVILIGNGCLVVARRQLITFVAFVNRFPGRGSSDLYQFCIGLFQGDMTDQYRPTVGLLGTCLARILWHPISHVEGALCRQLLVGRVRHGRNPPNV